MSILQIIKFTEVECGGIYLEGASNLIRTKFVSKDKLSKYKWRYAILNKSRSIGVTETSSVGSI